MEGTGSYIVLVLIGVLITVAVGQILLRSGQPFLEDVFQKKETADSLNRLLVVLFHLLTLGVLGMISVVPLGDDWSTAQTMVFRIGVVLLIVGLAYGISMLVLLRIRERRRQAAVSAAIDEKLAEQRQNSRGGRTRRADATGPGEARSAPGDEPGD
ncbi:hypothetical protein WIS52_31150 [Pseudonocardia nematodicida]|uniref:Integral membrane protein n=1 Tax=Pseudonocardia nematodicida TaxID=1206997 RepID=A0ABV1KKF2_9PSEU